MITISIEHNPQQALPVEVIARIMNFMDAPVGRRDSSPAEFNIEPPEFICDRDLGDEDPADLFEV